MLFRNASLALTAGLALAVTGSAATAQGAYGSITGSASFANYDTNDNLSNETGEAQTVSGFAGMSLGAGFIEGDLRFTHQTADDNDLLARGTMAALRYGMALGSGTGEAIIGYANVAHESDSLSAERYFGIVGFSKAVSDRLSFSTQVGYMNGSTQVGDDSADSLRSAGHVGIGLDYAISDRVGLSADLYGGWGKTDQDNESAQIAELVVGVEYQLAQPGLSAFGEVALGDYYQFGEDDYGQEARITLGVTYAFGGSERTRQSRLAIPRYENWMNFTGGVLE